MLNNVGLQVRFLVLYTKVSLPFFFLIYLEFIWGYYLFIFEIRKEKKEDKEKKKKKGRKEKEKKEKEKKEKEKKEKEKKGKEKKNTS